MVGYSDMQKILTKLEVAKAIDTTIEKQQSLKDTLWNEFLSTSFESCNIIRREQKVTKTVISEMLKVL